MKKQLLPLFLGLMICAFPLSAQVTTSAIAGYVMDASHQPLPGANIVATHVPSGTVYGVIARDDGAYTIPNMRVGGPYHIEVSFLGYDNDAVDDIYLKLGEKLRRDFLMNESNTQLGEVEVVGAVNSTINRDRTGAASFITNNQIKTMPTITRSAADLTRLNPMAAEGGSFAGRNDQFNNYSLDGAIFNNPFGLDAATPGGQTEAQPVSLDAIDQIIVNIAPFDVTQSGFTGASIDAVTKSGTNTFNGSVFGYYRNKDMIGTKVGDTKVTKGDLKQLQTGFNIGGPIVKNKIFFFANFEIERRSDLGSYFLANRPGLEGSNVSRVSAADLDRVSFLLDSVYGYKTGQYENYKHNTNNQKGLFKLDFNLSKSQKLTATINYLDALKEKPAHPSAIGRRGPDFQTLQFENSGYQINNKILSGIIELKSIFGNTAANKLQAGFTSFKDSRDPFSAPFPVVNIGKDGVRYIVAGHEPFSIHNILNQDVLQLSDNFNLYLKGHTLTIGGSLEKFSFDNSFNLTGYGARVFFPDIPITDVQSVFTSQAFHDEVSAARAAFDANNTNNTWALAETDMGQLAFYGQDEWAMSNKLSITVGLRADIPLYFDTPTKVQENIDRNCCYDPTIVYSDEHGNPVTFDQKVLPASDPLWSPRVGFNFDINGDQSSQLRGGTGLFTGRFPFVWVGNQVANPNFFFYCVTDPNFKYPQVWRSDLGYDQKFGTGWTVSADVIYTKDIQAAMVRNYGLKLPTSMLTGVGARPIYGLNDRVLVFGAPTNAYVFTNTDVGSSFNASIQFRKDYANNFGWTLAYNYLDSKDAASIDAEISSDAYDRNPANVQHTNTAELAPSLYGNKHRVVGSLYKRFSYGKSWATHIALFAEYVQGGRYSYTYSGDINNDGSGLNDLIYIPTSGDLVNMVFAGDATAQSAQRNALESYIAQDDYLSGRRGQIAEKYGAINPWYSRWDARIMQEYGLKNGDNIQLSLDILNLGNLISPKWGVREIATNTGLVQPIGVTVANGVATYSFDTAQKTAIFNDFSLNSRWQAQLGLRYNF
ncbi:MAG: TonB-dependent receptor [Saprospiraceae bacterium]|uniref:TonB-dependent receptor n=1 Tax=Candidatus Opimibacter skivensis TaxID=2982028 RepID=A0A9D7SX84_9BACT|nr:TonB-dependent receptor [Candidatus Opimibacter skivensis]